MTTTYKVLGSQSRVAGGGIVRTLYTVPAGHTAILETVDLHNFGSSVDCGFGILHGSTQFTLQEVSSLGFNTTLSWRGKHVIPAGDSFYVYGAVGATLSCYASGYEIS